jgi:hypothetical protein
MSTLMVGAPVMNLNDNIEIIACTTKNGGEGLKQYAIADSAPIFAIFIRLYGT